MKFIKLNHGYVNIDHIVWLRENEVPAKNGDFYIEIRLTNEDTIYEPEVSYQAMMVRFSDIIESLNY